MASCAKKGSVVSAITVGSAARAAADARVMIQAGGVGAVPGTVGSMKKIPILVVLNSEDFLVRARFPSSVVYDVMVIMGVSMAS